MNFAWFLCAGALKKNKQESQLTHCRFIAIRKAFVFSNSEKLPLIIFSIPSAFYNSLIEVF